MMERRPLEKPPGNAVGTPNVPTRPERGAQGASITWWFLRLSPGSPLTSAHDDRERSHLPSRTPQISEFSREDPTSSAGRLMPYDLVR